MSRRTCPYNTMPEEAFWKRVVAGVAPSDVDPVGTPPFMIARGDKVATAGSCFAQHIARHMRSAGMQPFVTEPAPPPLDEATANKFQYGTYSARYGNIYTTRQLLQLLECAFDGRTPLDSHWRQGGRYFDPYRPSVQPDGFHSLHELACDRISHLRAVRRLFEELDIFIFTLGLTEAWMNREDGMVYPVCPGCGWGNFDPAKHEFVNFGVDEVVADLQSFIDRLHEINPRAKVVLTVSPVPLVATAEARHVLQSTTVSKSVLRVAADIVQRKYHSVAYFPSYEIITAASSRGRYFAEDLRSVLPEGVEHVMRTFFSAYLPHARMRKIGSAEPEFGNKQPTRTPADVLGTERVVEKMVDLICEEEQLDNDA